MALEAYDGLEDHRGEGAAEGRGRGAAAEDEDGPHGRIQGAHGARGVRGGPSRPVRLPAPELRQAEGGALERDRRDRQGEVRAAQRRLLLRAGRREEEPRLPAEGRAGAVSG